MPQQRRAHLTRRAIVVAAAEEFDHVGYDGTPLSAILRRGGVTKGAFYFHFASKEALAFALIRMQGKRWPRLQQQWLDRRLDPLSTLVGMIGEAARLIESDVVLRAGTELAHHRIAHEVDPRHLPDWESVLGDLLRSSSSHGLLRPGVDPSALARVIHASTVGVRVVAAGRGGHPGVAGRVEEFWRVILDGVASADWLRRHPERVSGATDGEMRP